MPLASWTLQYNPLDDNPWLPIASEINALLAQEVCQHEISQLVFKAMNEIETPGGPLVILSRFCMCAIDYWAEVIGADHGPIAGFTMRAAIDGNVIENPGPDLEWASRLITSRVAGDHKTYEDLFMQIRLDAASGAKIATFWACMQDNIRAALAGNPMVYTKINGVEIPLSPEQARGIATPRTPRRQRRDS